MIEIRQSADNAAVPHLTESFDLLRMDRKIARRVHSSRYVRATAWAAVVLLGLRRRGVLGVALAAFGASRVVRALQQGTELWPKPRRIEPRQARDAAIDHASWESFPASDPPGVR